MNPFLSKVGFGQCYGSIKKQIRAAVSTLQAGNTESRKLIVVLYAVYSNKTRIICTLWSFVAGNSDNGKQVFVFSLFQNTYWRENTHSLITKGTGHPWCQGA